MKKTFSRRKLNGSGAHNGKPSYLGGKDREDCSPKPALNESETLSEN
jgi:hypothetical protein